MWFSDCLALERNYYDQVIHFLFGFMIVIPFYQIFDHQGFSRNMSYLIAFLIINTISALYEILEWLAMEVFCKAPNCLELLTQADEWDTQKDMVYSTIGACICMLLHRIWHKGENRARAQFFN